jgi:fatty acid amide hydrolase
MPAAPQAEGPSNGLVRSSADDVCCLSASELARRIAAGEVSAIEAVEGHIARVEKVNAALNAVVVKRYDAARAEAREVDARRARGDVLPPLAGVPITIKECLHLEGTPSTSGILSRADAKAPADDAYVRRLRSAGAIVLGKTNAAQLLIFTETDNPLYGRTNNPWNLDRSAGGSSGGEGAIVAAGGSTLGVGTDIGGSVRIPAAFCGIAGLRPTAGRLPDMGRLSVPIGQRGVASQVGLLARHVEDLALGLDVLGNGIGGPALAPPVPLGDFRRVDVGKLRVGVFVDDGVMTPAPAVGRSVKEAASMLVAAGATIVTWQPPSVATAMAIWFGCLSADGGRGMKKLVRGQKTDKRAGLFLGLAGMPNGLRAVVTRILEAFGQRQIAAAMRLFAAGDVQSYWQAVEALIDYEQEFRRHMDFPGVDGTAGGPLDAVLCPAYAVPAVRHGAAADMPLAGAYSLLAPVLGYPAGIVPVTSVRSGEESARPGSRDRVERTARATEEGSIGLPIGVQIIARPWQESVTLAAMRTIERAARARPDYPHTPTIVRAR